MGLLAVALTTAVGCGGGGSGDKDSGLGNDGGPGILAVTVNATGLSPAMRTAIQSLLLRVEGDTTDTTIIVPPGAFDDENHTENFTPAGHTGAIRLQVTARNDTGGVISIAASSVTVVPGVTTPVTVTLTESSPIALLVVEPSPVDFGNIVLGAPVGRVMVTVRNSGGTASGPLTSVISGDTAVFVIDPATTCDGKTLAPAESCMFAMEFRPTQEGARTASLAMTASPGGTATVSLTGTGATPAVLVVSPEIENLGDVETGTFGPSHTITFMNTGGSPTGALMSTIGGTDAADIKIATDGCSNQPLNAGSTCTLTLQLRPTTRGAKSGMLTMVGAPGGTTVTTLTGRGLTPSALEVNPTMQDFGTAVTNTMSEATFTVRNGGEVTTGALMITLGGVNFDEFSLPNDSCNTTTLAFGATCSVTVRFRPTTVGPKSATLRIRGTPGGDITAALSGTAAGPGALAITPASIDFGGIVVGQSSTTRTFTVTNTGGAATGALSVSLGGTSASQFVVQTDTCTGQSLAPSPGGMCTVSYQLRPSSAGGKTASLIVASNPGGTATASLVGSGLAAAVLSANATTAALGLVDVGAIGGSFTWTVTNVGGVPTGTLATSSTGDAADMLISGNCTQVLAVGASCTISVTLAPQTGGAKSTTITVTGSPGGSVSLVATGTARPPQVLTVTKAGTGTGTISSNPAGIACPADCTEGYRYNTTVTLTAAPTGGATFTGWTGACTGTGACIISMVIDQNVTATFAAPRYQLTVSTSGVSTGTVTSTNVAGITCGADCSELYDSGTPVTLMAQEAAGYSFGGWAGGGCGGLVATCSVTMNMARTVTATFTQNSYAMAITVNGMGRVTSSPIGIDCTASAGDCGEPYLSGTTVTLTAAPTAGHSFMGWTVGAGNCTGMTSPCTVGMTGARNLTATFVAIPVVLTVAKNGNGTGTVTSDSGGINCGTGSACMGTYASGTPVLLTAAPDTGMRVSAWNGGSCTGTGLTCTVTPATDTTVTVTFTKLTYTIMSSKTGAGDSIGLIDADVGTLNCGTNCNATYNHGDVIVLTATPGTQNSRLGFFLGWGGTLSGGVDCMGTGTCTLTVTAGGTITARFETSERVRVTIPMSSMGMGSVVSTPAGIDCSTVGNCDALFPANTSVTLTATPSGTNTFDNWSGGGSVCSGTSNVCTFTLATSDVSTTVNFKAP